MGTSLGMTTFIIGLIGTVCVSIYTYPSLINLLRTKDSTKISLLGFGILIFADFSFLLQSILSGIVQSWNDTWITNMLPILIANAMSLIGALSSYIYKICCIIKAKKINMTEEEYCKKRQRKEK